MCNSQKNNPEVSQLVSYHAKYGISSEQAKQLLFSKWETPADAERHWSMPYKLNQNCLSSGRSKGQTDDKINTN